MNLFKIKDNQLKLKTDFADVKAITDIIADKTFEQLEKDGIFVFPEVIKDADLYKERISSDGYGISLKGSKLLESLGSAREEMVLGVLGNADNKDYEYISKLVNYILQKSSEIRLTINIYKLILILLRG